MDEILVKPEHLRMVAQNLGNHAKNLKQQLLTVDSIINSLPSEFEGNRAQDFMGRYRNTRESLLQTWELISAFGTKLNDIAQRFEQADRKLSTDHSRTIRELIDQVVKRIIIYQPGRFWIFPWREFLEKEKFHFLPFFPTLPWFPKLPIRIPEFPTLPFLPSFPKFHDFNPPKWFSPTGPDWIQLPQSAERAQLISQAPAVEQPAVTISPAPAEISSPAASSTLHSGKALDVIRSLDVEHADPYVPYHKGKGDTYCNIFASDYANRMGAPLPQNLDWNGDGKIDRYLNANLMVQWLRGNYGEGGAAVQQGPTLGWQSVSATEAAQMANKGNVVIAGWENPEGTWSAGHMAVVRPESQPGNIRIAQAGSSNFEDGSLVTGFVNHAVEFFVYRPM